MGFAQADAVAAVAPQYPDVNFVAVDVCWVDDPAGNIYQEIKMLIPTKIILF